MDELGKIWSALPWYLKLLAPLLIVALFFEGGRNFISSFLEKRARTAADKEIQKVNDRIDALKTQDAQETGVINTLESEKAKAVEAAKTDDAVDYYNKRDPKK